MKNKRSSANQKAKDFSEKELKAMEAIHHHWEERAKQYQKSHSVSWDDINMIQLEIQTISKFFNENDYLLDAGCSNGFTTLEILKNHKVRIEGIDYSQKAIELAQSQKENNLLGQVNFSSGNILFLPYEDQTFDKVYTIRTMINLPTFSMQKKAIKELHRVLKPGGQYLMSEAFTSGLHNLNKLRSLANLQPLTVPSFNLYLEETPLQEFLSDLFDIQEISNFSSLYYVASRFVRYLTIDSNESDSYVNHFNNFFKKITPNSQAGDFGVQKLYVLRKK